MSYIVTHFVFFRKMQILTVCYRKGFFMKITVCVVHNISREFHFTGCNVQVIEKSFLIRWHSMNLITFHVSTHSMLSYSMYAEFTFPLKINFPADDFFFKRTFILVTKKHNIYILFVQFSYWMNSTLFKRKGWTSCSHTVGNNKECKMNWVSKSFKISIIFQYWNFKP